MNTSVELCGVTLKKSGNDGIRNLWLRSGIQ